MGKYTDPNWGNSALITIDVQRDFALAGAPAYIVGTIEVVPVLQRLVRAFREAGRSIVHVVRLYRPDGPNVDVCCREGVERA
jgi:nicotinamidase-related amidase